MPSPFSAASSRGLIEVAAVSHQEEMARVSFPRHRAAASLKCGAAERDRGRRTCARFPRHRAAASLKWGRASPPAPPYGAFSAASSRGLIEVRGPREGPRVPRAVFRGIEPRPH